MPKAKSTSEITTTSELARRAAIKRELTAIVDDEPTAASELAAEIDDAKRPLVRLLADELVADGVLDREPAFGPRPRRYTTADEPELRADGGTQRWSDYSTRDDTRGAIHRNLLQKRKRRVVEREYDVSPSVAAQWLRSGRVEVPDSEIEGWCPHDGSVRGGGQR